MYDVSRKSRNNPKCVRNLPEAVLVWKKNSSIRTNAESEDRIVKTDMPCVGLSSHVWTNVFFFFVDAQSLVCI